MASDIKSRRTPWIALALSFLSAGVGHLYCGRIAKGLPLYFAWALVPLGVTVAALSPPSSMSLVLLVLLPVVAVAVLYVYAAIDAWQLARKLGSDYSIRDYNRPAVYCLLIVVQMVFSIGLIKGACGFVYEAFVIPTNSMNPTILNGDRILARKLLPQNHFPKRGDLVVFKNLTSSKAVAFVDRVVAVAGDHVEIKGERLLINGTELQHDLIPRESLKHLGQQQRGQVSVESNSGRRYLVTYGESSDESNDKDDFDITVPERHVFVLGDNRDRSRDSRHFGPVHIGDIIGYPDYIFWPAESWSRFGVADVTSL